MKRKKLNFFGVIKTLQEKNILIFTLKTFSQIFPVSSWQASYFLEAYTEAGLFRRLKKGLYALENSNLDEKEIANALYQPSYLSLEYVLAGKGIIPERTYIVSSVTTKPTRLFEVGERGFSYLKIKRSAFTGYRLNREKIEGKTKCFLVAEPEKALVDYLYFVVLGHKKINDRLVLKNLNRKKIIRYAKLFKRKKLLMLIDELYDRK